MQTINISFQIMTRAEPVALVKETIRSLLAIKEAGDEILIVDNNHTDKTLYKPLQIYCESLDDSLNVQFYHEDFIAGYKAGALNYALERMDTMCDYIVVVDSDYQALPWARFSIASAIRAYPNHALLQFPQYYRDSDKPDIHTELNHYFSKRLRAHNNLIHSLSTGTFAVINRQALERLGGWSGDSITEDAQMGVLMHLKGECTRYVPQVIATGVLPSTLTDLLGQRRRWIYGNAQVLVTYPKVWLKSLYVGFKNRNKTQTQSKLMRKSIRLQVKLCTLSDFHKVRAHLSQLGAWINLTGVFIVLHTICLAVLLSISLFNVPELNMPDLKFLIYKTLSICYLSYGLFMGRRLLAYLTDDKPLLTPYGTRFDSTSSTHISSIRISSVHSSLNRSLNDSLNSSAINTRNDDSKTGITFKARLKAWLIHMSFWELGALSWLPVLWGQQKPFVSTPKFTVFDKRKNRRFTSFMAMPKLLIAINAVTATMVFSYSKILFVAALTVLLVKFLSHWTMIRNFENKAKKSSASESVKQSRLRKSKNLNASNVVASNHDSESHLIS